MNKKTNLFFLFWMLLFSVIGFKSNAAISTTVEGSNLTVSSDQNGFAGYQGCDGKTLREVPAFLYNLYKLETAPSSPNSCIQAGNWKIHAQRTSDVANNVQFENLTDGNYKVIGFYGAPEGCNLKSKSQNAIVYKRDGEQFINIDSNLDFKSDQESKSQSNISFAVFPNPTSDLVSIQLKEGILTAPVNISLINLFGQKVLDLGSQHNDCQNNCEINLSGIGAGSFFVLIEDNEGQILHQEKLVLIKK